MRMAADLQFSSRLFPRSSHGFRIGLRKHIPGDRTGPNPARGRLSASRAALRCNRIQLDARRNRANQPGFLFFTTVSASTNSERRVRCEGEWPTYPSPRKIRMSKNLEVTIFKTKDLRAAKMLLVATLAERRCLRDPIAESRLDVTSVTGGLWKISRSGARRLNKRT